MVKTLIKLKADLEENEYEYGYTWLTLAAGNNCLGVVETLMN